LACTTCGHYAAPPNTLCDDCLATANPELAAARTAEVDRTRPQRVTIVDVDIPIGKLVTLQIRMFVASLPLVLAIVLVFAVCYAQKH
jgi:hypothetical protein